MRASQTWSGEPGETKGVGEYSGGRNTVTVTRTQLLVGVDGMEEGGALLLLRVLDAEV